MKKALRGITLIELLVVLAIISILALVAYAGLSNARDQAKISSLKASMDSLIPAAEVHYLSNLTYANFTIPSALTDACSSSKLNCTCNVSNLSTTTWQVSCTLSSPAFTWICENNGTQTYCH